MFILMYYIFKCKFLDSTFCSVENSTYMRCTCSSGGLSLCNYTSTVNST